MSEHLVIHVSRQRDFSQITYLNLFNNCIRKIQSLDQLTSLETLILSYNQIEQIQGLGTCQSLQKLDLNHNFIR